MSLQEIATIIGIITGGGAVSLAFIKTLLKIYDFYARLESLERQNTNQTRQIESFKTEFQRYFLKAEQQEQARWTATDRRLDRLEKGLAIFIAKNKGTIPPLGED